MKHKVKSIHFIGIGGVGMSGIAEVLHNLGYYVSGSDVATNYTTKRLEQIGINIGIGHLAKHIHKCDVVVTSSAITSDNIELITALKKGIPVIPRAMMLAELMRFKYGVAIAGTHGKTTTTSLCAEILAHSGLDPTFIVGGKLGVTDSNAKLGAGDYLVAEADESDASFLYLNPLIAVVTNIDLDHMATYNHDEQQLKQTFIEFLHKLPFYGRAILCNEDERIRSIIPLIKSPFTTYGLDGNSDIYATNIKHNAGKVFFTLHLKDLAKTYPVELNLPGEYNILNSLAAIAVGIECGCELDSILHSLKCFQGVGRRVQRYPNLTTNNKVAYLIDDYAHHPTELQASLKGLEQAYPDKRLVLVFQPHRYTRTQDLFAEFVLALAKVQNLIIVDTYAAGEEIIPEANGQSLIKAIKLLSSNANISFAKDLITAKEIIVAMLEDNDLIVTMGAGNIANLPKLLLENKVG